MTEYRSSDLGWSANQDVSREFESLVENTFKEGDTFVLDHMYEISSFDHALPDNFTLTAKDGAGFDITGTGNGNNQFLHVGNGNVINNVTFLHSDTPDTEYTGNHAQAGQHFHKLRTVVIDDKSDVVISDSHFKGNPESFVRVDGGTRLNVENTIFDGARTQMVWHESTTDFVVRESILKNALGDGIKTVKAGGFGAERHQIIDSVFENNNRDGLDTTGGFKDSVVSGTIFRGNGVSGMDIKTPIHNESDISENIKNENIRISDTEFTDNRNAVVITFSDRIGNVIDAGNADDLVPNHIFLEGVTVENSVESMEGGGQVRAVLLKDGHHIQWNDMKLLGDVDEVRVLNAEAPDGWTSHSNGGNVIRGEARPVSTDYPITAGPGGGALTTVESEPEADTAPEPESETVPGTEAAPEPEAGSDPETTSPEPASEEETDTDESRDTTLQVGDVDLATNAGGETLDTTDGTAFGADDGFSGGKTFSVSGNTAIAGTQDDALYRTERYGDFDYSQAVADGTYEVTLKFAEVYHGSAGERVFDVKAEGDLVLDDFDIVEAAGGKNVAHDVTIPVTVSDGQLDLEFLTEVDNAKLSGLEIRALDTAQTSQPDPAPVEEDPAPVQEEPAPVEEEPASAEEDAKLPETDAGNANDSPYDLVWSDVNTRENAKDLEGATLDDDVFVFTTGTEDAAQVNFYLDDPTASGKPIQVERVFSHDFAGGSADRANAWDTSTIEDGTHTITAEVIGVDGSATLLFDTFSVINF